MAGQTFLQKIKIFLEGADKAASDSRKVSNGMKGLAKSAIAAGGAYFGARGIINAMKESINLYKEQQLAEVKLEAALGKTSRGLQRYAASLQRVTNFGDELILQGMAQLAFFIKDEEQLKVATKATLDLAAAKGMDLVQAADLVAKSVGSSTNALSRYGIAAEGAVGSNERLLSITGEISNLFGGQAEATTQSLSGSLDQMQNALGDVFEVIGESLAPAVQYLADGFTDLVSVPVSQQLQADRIEMNALFNIIKDTNYEQDVRQRALEELNSTYETYLPYLLNEKTSLEEIEKAQSGANAELMEAIRLKAQEEELVQITKDYNDVIVKRFKLTKEYEEAEVEAMELLKTVNASSKEEYKSLEEFQGGFTKRWIDRTKEAVESGRLLADETPFASDLGISEAEVALNRQIAAYMGLGIQLGQTNMEFEEFEQEMQTLIAAYGTLDEILEKQNEEGGSGNPVTSFNVLKTVLPEVNQTYIPFINLKAQEATVTDIATEAEKKQIKILQQKKGMYSDVFQAGAKLFGLNKKNAKAVADMQALQAVSDAWFASQLSFKQANASAYAILNPAYPYIVAGATLAQGLATAAQVRATARAEEGMNQIVTEPTLILAGEAGPEYVDIEPTVNEGEGRGGASIVFQGNVLSRDFIEDEAIPLIKDAIRKGGDIGIG